MAEPKGGPVKPPTLDLKASKSRRTSTSPSSSDPDGNNRNRAKQHTPTSSSKNQNASPRSNVGNKDGATPKAAPKSTPRPNVKPDIGTLSSNFSKSVIWGAIGGAALALFLIIPLLLLGIIRSPVSKNQTDQLNQLAVQFSAAQEQNVGNSTNLTDLTAQLNSLFDQLELQRSEAISLKEQFNQQVSAINQTQQSLGTKTDELSARQNVFMDVLDSLQSQTGPAFDASELQQDIQDLHAQIAALSAAAGSQDPEAVSQNLAVSQDIEQMRGAIQDLQSRLQTQLQTQLNATEQQNLQAQTSLSEKIDAQNDTINELNRLANERLGLINQQAQTIEQLRTSTQTLANSLAQTNETLKQTASFNTPTSDDTPTDTPAGAPNVSLPVEVTEQQTQLLIDSTYLALANGQPFLPQLETLANHFSEIEVTPTMRESARNALASPNYLIQLIDAAVPDMLAARPPEPDAGFLSQVSNSIKSALAIRPTGLTNGDPIENTLNQAIAATDRSDFASAFDLFESLPQSMVEVLKNQQEQQDLYHQIENFGDIQIFLEDVQQQINDTAQHAVTDEGNS